ncbi:MAG: hypothetical protein AUH42_01375 [Gemmatimonadetes bacterium 13_1_40CM_70_11]|nr:MAG: hypothetical protein AUH42_01375 [Gemmatimonadetes bacterium 13_1_40CM_70_11]
MELQGRAGLVTGAGRRVGQAIAIGLAQAGCDVAVHYHGSAAGAEETAGRIRASGRRLDILINSAAILVRQPVAEVTPESWDQTLNLNLRAMFFVSQGAIPHLRRAHGKIINLADVAAFEPWPAYVPHCVSKAGVVMLTQGLARALAPDIAVNAVAPGAVLLPDDWDAATRAHFAETTPLQRLGSAEDVVSAVRFLLAGTDYVTGTVLVVDGGRLIR